MVVNTAHNNKKTEKLNSGDGGIANSQNAQKH